MNVYRIALVLCRAVAIALWWRAGVGALSAAVMFVVAQLSVASLKGVPALAMSGQSLFSAALTALAAGFLQIFAASLAASMTGGAAFEGESILSRRVLDAPEKALANAGAGLFLLFPGVITAAPSLLASIYTFLFQPNPTGAGAKIMFLSMIYNAVPTTILCAVGFVLAFQSGLRRVIKPETTGEAM